MEEKRKSNFELLRIFAMFMIVAHHFAVHSNFQFPSGFTTINRAWIQFIAMGGKIGVNIFVMISGYFLVNSTQMKWNKVLKIWSQLIFYVVVIYLFCIVVGLESFSVEGLKMSFFPVGQRRWWFASTYLVLYIFTPYINLVMKSIGQQQLQKMLLVMTVLWCILPMIKNYAYESNELLWFLYIYCLGAYVRMYGFLDEKWNGKVCFFAAIVAILSTYFYSVIIDYTQIKSGSVVFFANHFYKMQSFMFLIISFCIFVGFAKMKIKHSKMINMISTATFGVYLIHDDGFYMQKILWNTILKTSSYTHSKWFVLYSILVIIVVFISCGVIELLRIKFIEPFVMKFWECLMVKIKQLCQIKLK